MNTMNIGNLQILTNWRHLLCKSDIIFHLAGVNRSDDDNDFKEGNVDLTKSIVEILLNLTKRKK